LSQSIAARKPALKDIRQFIKTMQKEIFMLPYDRKNEMKYMLEHPPTCIKLNWTKPNKEITEIIQKNFGKNTTTFGIKCTCSNNNLTVFIDFNGSCKIQCLNCNNEFEIFNITKHGYEGALGERDEEEFNQFRQIECDACKSVGFDVFTAYQYSGETDVLEDDDCDCKPEDLFGWYAIVLKCKKCGAENKIVDFECA